VGKGGKRSGKRGQEEWEKGARGVGKGARGDGKRGQEDGKKGARGMGKGAEGLESGVRLRAYRCARLLMMEMALETGPRELVAV